MKVFICTKTYVCTCNYICAYIYTVINNKIVYILLQKILVTEKLRIHKTFSLVNKTES